MWYQNPRLDYFRSAEVLETAASQHGASLRASHQPTWSAVGRDIHAIAITPKEWHLKSYFLGLRGASGCLPQPLDDTPDTDPTDGRALLPAIEERFLALLRHGVSRNRLDHPLWRQRLAPLTSPKLTSHAETLLSETLAQQGIEATVRLHAQGIREALPDAHRLRLGERLGEHCLGRQAWHPQGELALDVEPQTTKAALRWLKQAPHQNWLFGESSVPLQTSIRFRCPSHLLPRWQLGRNIGWQRPLGRAATPSRTQGASTP